MSTTVQGVFIRGHETRSQPKPHTVYRIEVQGSVRSWTVWRRYSEFDDLHTELDKSTGAPPPTDLPPKHAFTISLRRTFDDEDLIKERIEGLEKWLRAIVGSKEGRWRDSAAFKEFLSMPASTSFAALAGTSAGTNEAGQFTSSSWLDEQTALQSLVRDIKSDINKRQSLSDSGDISASHQANVQAKKKLSSLLTRIGLLAKGLDDLQSHGMNAGEVQRRGDMIARLQDECEKLGKMVVASRQSTTSRVLASSSAVTNPAPQADRDSLLGGGRGTPPGSRGFTRVFGAAALETDVTRPLDEPGLVQLQQTQMDTQDSQLGELSTILRRQKQIGLAIGDEISSQNELLDRLSTDVDAVGSKLTGAKKQLNKLG